MADEVVFMQALHNQNDAVLLLVVEPAIQRIVVPFVDGIALTIGECFIGLERIVDDNEARPKPGYASTDRSGPSATLVFCFELLDRLPVSRETGPEGGSIPVARHYAATIARQLIGELLRVADAQDLCRGIVTQNPGRQRDGSAYRFEVARWDVDDETADLALPTGLELGRDHLDMPVREEMVQNVRARRATRPVRPSRAELGHGQQSQ
jgi:hypothetical protein